jgi:hypothetical protein
MQPMQYMYIINRKLTLICLAILIILIAGCKKDKDKKEEAQKETHLYVAGYHTTPSSEIACYWKDSTRVMLSIGSAPSAQAYAIFVTGNDVHVAGRTSGPSYWKNGVRTDLPVLDGGIYSGGMAKCIYASGDTVCVGGYCKNSVSRDVPCYWKNGVRVDLPKIDNSKDGYVESVYMVGNTVYASGYTDKYPCYWRNGLRIADLSMPDGAAWGNTSGICVSGADVYIAGNTRPSLIVKYSPCYWKNGMRIDLPKLNDSSDGQTTGIYIYGSDVYIAGYTRIASNFQQVACYWKNGVRTDLFNTEAGLHNTGATAVYVTGSTVMVAGYIVSTAGAYIPCYWKNGIRYDSHINPGPDIHFTSNPIIATN